MSGTSFNDTTSPPWGGSKAFVQVVSPSEGNVGIQTAINAVFAAGGGKVQLMDGTYLIDTGMTIPAGANNITIQGNGDSTILSSTILTNHPVFNFNGNYIQSKAIDNTTKGDTKITFTTHSDAAAVLTGDRIWIEGTDVNSITDVEWTVASGNGNGTTGEVPIKQKISRLMTSVTAVNMNGGENIKLKDFRITAPSTPYPSAISFNYTYNTILEELTIDNWSGEHYATISSVAYGINNIVRYCNFKDTESYVIIFQNQIGARVEHNNAQNILYNTTNEGGLVFANVPCYDCKFTDNYIFVSGQRGIAGDGSCRRITVTGNTILNTLWEAIYIGANESIVEHNIIENCDLSGAICLSEPTNWPANYSSVSHNFVRNAQAPIQVYCPINVSITNNILVDAAEYGIRLFNAHGCKISDNIIKNSAGTAIKLINLSGGVNIDNEIAGNIIDGAGNYDSFGNGIKLDANSDRNSIIGNKIRNTTGLAIVVNSINNTIRGNDTGTLGMSVVAGNTLTDVSFVYINPQTGDYTLALTDVNTLIDMNSSSILSLTIPKNSSVAFPIGTIISARQKGTGAVVLSPEDGTVIIQGNGVLKTAAQNAIISIIQVAANSWVAYGDLYIQTTPFVFTVVTPNPSDTFTLPLTNTGNYNFIVDWGDSSPTQRIMVWNDSATVHTYSIAGTYQISMTGICTEFAFNNTGDKLKIKELNSFTDMGFSIMNFYGCSNLDTIDTSMYNLTSITTARDMFKGCTAIATLDEDMFFGMVGCTSFYGTFQGCTGLTAIPAHLFDNNTKVTTFRQTFEFCTNVSLTTIPADLFKYNTKVLSFEYVFDGCTKITTISADLYKYNTKVTAFYGAMQGMTALTAIPSGIFDYNTKVEDFGSVFGNCSNAAFTVIPNNLFDNNTEVLSFGHVFQGCTHIAAVPTDLFKFNIKVTDMNAAFAYTAITTLPADIFKHNVLNAQFDFICYSCTNLATIPAALFDYNPLVTTFEYAFTNDSALNQALPPDIFLYNLVAVNFGHTFSGCSALTSLGQPIIDNTALPGHSTPTTTGSCFTGCTGLTDYASLPAGWK